MEYIKNKFIDLYTFFGYSDYNKIINNLYVGNYKSCQNEIITKENFEIIINCTPNLPFRIKILPIVVLMLKIIYHITQIS